jgi:hypothetical protein
MAASLRSCSPGARGHPLDHQLGSLFTRTQATPARTSALRSATNSNQQRSSSPIESIGGMVSIRPSSNSTTIDRDAANEDGLSTLPNTRSQTCTSEVHWAPAQHPTATVQLVAPQAIRRPRPSGMTGWQSKEQVANPHARPLKL